MCAANGRERPFGFRLSEGGLKMNGDWSLTRGQVALYERDGFLFPVHKDTGFSTV